MHPRVPGLQVAVDEMRLLGVLPHLLIIPRVHSLYPALGGRLLLVLFLIVLNHREGVLESLQVTFFRLRQQLLELSRSLEICSNGCCCWPVVLLHRPRLRARTCRRGLEHATTVWAS
jgi:hypothetical protein